MKKGMLITSILLLLIQPAFGIPTSDEDVTPEQLIEFKKEMAKKFGLNVKDPWIMRRLNVPTFGGQRWEFKDKSQHSHYRDNKGLPLQGKLQGNMSEKMHGKKNQ